jgi:alcohol dehydrogenase (NADP+)
MCNRCELGYQGVYLGSNAGCWGKTPHNEHGGCFSKVMRIEEHFAVRLPDNLPPEIACPMMCGGATVFESIVDYVQNGTRVAVSSIGGLGTAAIKFSKAFGGHVTALSRSEDKRDKALAEGADDFYACLGQPDQMKTLEGRFDVIIDTSPKNADVAPFMTMLKFNGTYCRVGIPSASDMDFTYSYIPLIFTQKKIAGSVVCGTLRLKRMFQLIKDQPHLAHDPENWKTKIVPFDQVNEIMDDLLNGRNKENWRYVLQW